MACIAKRRDRYIIDFYDNQGKRRWKTLPKGTTKKQAREFLREIENKLDKGVFIPFNKIPSFSEIADNWLENKKQNIRHSTLKQYSGHLGAHLKPYFKDMPINKVGYEQVIGFLSHCHESGVTVSTTKKILINLGAIMTFAVRMRYIDHNPVRDVEKPRGKSVHEDNSEIEIMTPGEIRLFLDAAPDMKHKTLFMAAVSTGLRQGELLGLKWTDIDWFNNQIYVKRTYNHFRFYEPKTKKSKRKIDLPPQMIEQFKLWNRECMKNDLDLVFPNETGGPMAALNMYNRKFLPALKKAGLKKYKFHSLRHSYASLLIDQGENIKYIQHQMGHSTIKVTMDTYGHLLKDVNKDAAKRLGKAIFETTGSKMVAEIKKGFVPKPLSP
jgi:integrase